MLAGTLAGVLTVMQAAVLSRAVARVFLQGFDLGGVQTLLLALVGLAFGRAAFTWFGELAAARVARRVKNDLRGRLADHIVRLGPAFLRSTGGDHAEGERTGELVNTALEGVEALDAYFAQYLPQLALAAVVPVTFLLFVFPIDPLSALVLLLTAPLIPLFMALIGSLTDALTRRQWSTLSRLAAHFLDVLQGLTTLKLFNRSREQIVLIRRISEQHRDATLQVLRVAFLSAFVLEMVGTLSTAIVAVEVGLRLLAGRLTFEPAFFLLILAPEFYLPLRQLGLRFHAGVAGVAAAQRIFELLETPAPPEPGAAPTAAPTAMRISFQRVTVTYPDRALPALHDVSFDIGPGQRVALVGATGAGKSTAASLLLRFVEPQGGRITVDGVALAALPAGEWRRQVAYVPQAPYLLNASVADNIRLGAPDAMPEAVEAAATAARAHEFIQALPQGYDTIIGERGARLSGGQAQRIALARAFLMDAPLIILDEATANLDPATDADVQASLADLFVGRTALLIAHRLGTVRRADKIVVLDAGRVVEEGTHASLLAAGGHYAGLVGAQGHPVEPAAWAAAHAARAPAAEGPAGVPSPGSFVLGPEAPDREPVPVIARDLPVSGVVEDEPSRAPSAPAPRALRGLLPFLAPYTRWIALSVLLGFLTVGSSIGLLSASAWIIATAALQPSVAVLQVAIVGVRFFGIARGVFRYLERLASHQVTFRVLAAVRVWFYAAIEPLAPARLGRYDSGDLLARVLSDVGTLENFYVRAVSPPLVAVLIALLTAVILAAFHRALVLPVLGLQAVAGIGLPLLPLWLGGGPGRTLTIGRSRLNQALVDLVQGLPDLLAFRAADRQLARVAGHGSDVSAAAAAMSGITSAANAAGSLLMWLAVAAVLAVATPLVRGGGLDGVSLAVLAMVTIASFEAVLPLPVASQYLAASAAAAQRLWHAAGKAPTRGDVAAALHFEPRAEGIEPADRDRSGPPGVEFANVTLRYAPDEPPALDQVSLVVPPGELLTIVGASGAGKSTVANALLRFWDCQAGTIRMGGLDVRLMSGDAVRSMAGVVAQQTHLFNATIRTNLLLARPAATQAELEQAARAAQIHDFIAALPDGYDTRVGEGGRQLSGGERQRVAIARALLKDAPVLILDEPAAALDAVTEAELWVAIAPLLAGRTTILITHHLGGPGPGGRIAVMAHGRVVEMGDHAALLAAGGVYRRLWDQQQAAISCPGAGRVI